MAETKTGKEVFSVPQGGFLQKVRTFFSAGIGADAPRAESIPRMETPRLVLRQLVPADAEDMYEYSCREEVTRYLLWEPHRSVVHTRAFLEDLQERYRAGDYYDWGLELRETGKLIGTVCFCRVDYDNGWGEIGYVIHSDYWRRGFAAEAVSGVLAFGFVNLNLNRIEAQYIIGNENSRRVMEKCGMTFEGIRRGAVKCKGAYRDVGICSVLRDEYFDPKHI